MYFNHYLMIIIHIFMYYNKYPPMFHLACKQQISIADEKHMGRGPRRYSKVLKVYFSHCILALPLWGFFLFSSVQKALHNSKCTIIISLTSKCTWRRL